MDCNKEIMMMAIITVTITKTIQSYFFQVFIKSTQAQKELRTNQMNYDPRS